MKQGCIDLKCRADGSWWRALLKLPVQFLPGNVPEGGGEAEAEAEPAAEEPKQAPEPKGKPEPKPEPKKAEAASKPPPAPEKKPEKKPEPSKETSSAPPVCSFHALWQKPRSFLVAEHNTQSFSNALRVHNS